MDQTHLTPRLSHCMYVEAGLDTRESSARLESCTARHFSSCIFSFLVVPDAFRALECIEHTYFSCIFLHRDLPNLNGIEALNILRTSGYQNGVILVVNQDDLFTIDNALAVGFSGLLRKPYSSLQLSDCIASCLQQPMGHRKPTEEEMVMFEI